MVNGNWKRGFNQGLYSAGKDLCSHTVLEKLITTLIISVWLYQLSIWKSLWCHGHRNMSTQAAILFRECQVYKRSLWLALLGNTDGKTDYLLSQQLTVKVRSNSDCLNLQISGFSMNWYLPAPSQYTTVRYCLNQNQNSSESVSLNADRTTWKF